MSCSSLVSRTSGAIALDFSNVAVSNASLDNPGVSSFISTGSSRSHFNPGTQRPTQTSTLNMAASPSYMASSRGALRVFGYHPTQGGPGATIMATVTFGLRTNETTYLRLVLGRHALSTMVRKLPGKDYHAWELRATVPADAYASHSRVALSVQALNGGDDILDSVVLGEFIYIHSALSCDTTHNFAVSDYANRLDHPVAPLMRRAESRGDMQAAQCALSELYSSIAADMRVQSGKLANFGPKKQSLIRTRRSGSGDEDSEVSGAILELQSSVESMSKSWDADELSACRRLVRFACVRDGSKLKVSCEPIKQDEYVDGDTVVSCIYRAETDSCFVTSVDIIFLLERLVGQEFDIDEKNRIRRNLEGFRPKTVSKNRPDSSDFFLQIMNFPVPKPRNIEKDVKVFDWNLLPQALDKIISKYILPTPGSETSLLPTPRSCPSSESSWSPESLPNVTQLEARSLSDNIQQSTSYMQISDHSATFFDYPAPSSQPSQLPPADHCLPSVLRKDSSVYYDSSAYSSTASTPMVSTPTGSQEGPHDALNEAAYVVDCQMGVYQRLQISDISESTGLVYDPFVHNSASIMAFDSIEFQTLREHSAACAISDCFV